MRASLLTEISRRTRFLTQSDPPPAKALYRRALAHGVLKDDDDAEKDLVQASELVRDDPAILGELEKVRARKKEKRDKEKKAFKKLFA